MNDNYFQTDEIFTRELTENERWFQGAEDRLEYFFKVEYNTFLQGKNNPFSVLENQTRFWRNVGGDTPRIHSGLPKLITKTMVNLIAGSEFEIEMDDDTNKARLETILESNEFLDKFQEAIANESHAGYVFFKINHDTDISEYPIIDVVSAKLADVVIKRGKIESFTFKTFNTDDNGDSVEVQEIYTKNDAGMVSITYKAFKWVKGKSTEIAPPKEYEDSTTLLPFFPAVLKNNTSYNSRFPNSQYGESDYTSSQGLFHMLDDLLSQTELEISNAKAVKYINSKLLKLDPNSKQATYDKNETVVEVSAEEMEQKDFDVKKFVSLVQPNIRVSEYRNTIADIYEQICLNVGLSPITVGKSGLSSVNSSDKSQREREKTSLRTRDTKTRLWRRGLVELLIKTLKYDDYMHSRPIGEYDLDISFSDYAMPTLDDKIDTIVKAVNGGVMTEEIAVDEMYPEMTDEEKAQTVLSLKLRNGVPLTAEEVGGTVEIDD